MGLQRLTDRTPTNQAGRSPLGPLAPTQLTARGAILGEWIADHWAPEHGATLEQSTRERYADVYRLHIEPWLDGIPLTELTVGRLRAWQADRVGAGIGVGTIEKARTWCLRRPRATVRCAGCRPKAWSCAQTAAT